MIDLNLRGNLWKQAMVMESKERLKAGPHKSPPGHPAGRWPVPCCHKIPRKTRDFYSINPLSECH
jgi:hypothetical protein